MPLRLPHLVQLDIENINPQSLQLQSILHNGFKTVSLISGLSSFIFVDSHLLHFVILILINLILFYKYTKFFLIIKTNQSIIIQ